MFLILKIMAFESVGGNFLYYEKDSWGRESRCSQAVVRSQILLTEMFYKLICYEIDGKLG